MGFIVIEFLRSIYYWTMTGLAALASLCFFPARVLGRENIPRRGGFILASNHESYVDPVLLPVVCFRQIRFMAKAELFRNPVLGFIIRTGGGFPVRRASADRGALNEFKVQMDLGYPVLIFPQGTRGGTRVQSGAGYLAVTSGRPVLPVYIHGSGNVLSKGGACPRRSFVTVVFGTPFILSSGLAYQDASVKIMESIMVLKNQV